MNLHLWGDRPREVRFIGFNREFTACLVLDGGGRRAIRLTLPRNRGLQCRRNPIADAAAKSEPVAITRTALHLPICAASKSDAENIRATGFFPWHRTVLHACYLDPKDDGSLKRLLGHTKVKLRQTRRARERAVVQRDAHSVLETAAKGLRRIRQLEQRLSATSHPGDAGLSPARLRDVRRRFAGWLRRKRLNCRSGRRHAFALFCNDGPRTKLVDELNVTFSDVKRGALGLRDKYLCDRWAKECGFDLEAIKRDAAEFRQWLKGFAFDTRFNAYDSTTREHSVRYDIQEVADKWEALEAAVCYELRFADGSRCWLDHVEASDKLTPQEAEDFEKLEQSADANGDRLMSRDEVRAYLKTDYQRKSGETTGPMGVKRLHKLCLDVLHRVPVFPIRLSVVKKLDAARKRGVRRRTAKLSKPGQAQ